MIAVAFVAASLLTTTARGTARAASTRPNVVIIMTDDQRWDTVTSRYMPQLTGILSRNPSITYTNSFVPNSLCCPSRTSTLTGDY
jgi:N-acetylglucosamine-6-sulfatase